jgi:hypothetical protein
MSEPREGEVPARLLGARVVRPEGLAHPLVLVDWLLVDWHQVEGVTDAALGLADGAQHEKGVGVAVLALVTRRTRRRACRRLVGQGGCGPSVGCGVAHGSHIGRGASFWRRIDRPTDFVEDLSLPAMRYTASRRDRRRGPRVCPAPDRPSAPVLAPEPSMARSLVERPVAVKVGQTCTSFCKPGRSGAQRSAHTRPAIQCPILVAGRPLPRKLVGGLPVGRRDGGPLGRATSLHAADNSADHESCDPCGQRSGHSSTGTKS